MTQERRWGIREYDEDDSGQRYDAPSDIEISGMAEDMVAAIEASENGDVGAVTTVTNLLKQAAKKMPAPAMAQVASRTTQLLASKYQTAMTVAKTAQSATDLNSPHQMIPVDSGDVLIAADGDTGTFSLTPNVDYEIVSMVVSKTMADKFGLKQLKVGGFDYLSLGFTVTGNGLNPSLTIAPFTPDYWKASPIPFLGRRFSSNTTITIVAHNISGFAARFMMGIGIQFDSLCQTPLGQPKPRPKISLAYRT